MPTTSTTAHELIREQVLAVLAPLTEQSVFLAAGPRIIDTAGPLRIPFGPTFDAGPVVMTAEGEEIPEIEAAWTDMQMLPSTMKSFKRIHRYTAEITRMSAVAVEPMLRTGLVARLAADVDTQLLGATGDGITTPRGLGAYQGVQTLAVGGALTVDHILDAQGLLMKANAPTSNLTMFVRPDDYLAIRGTKDAVLGAWVLDKDVNHGDLMRPILGCKVVPTTRIAEGTAYVAHMPSVAVARDVNPAVTILTERYAEFDEIGIRVVVRLDAAPLYPAAIVRLTGITTPSP